MCNITSVITPPNNVQDMSPIRTFCTYIEFCTRIFRKRNIRTGSIHVRFQIILKFQYGLRKQYIYYKIPAGLISRQRNNKLQTCNEILQLSNNIFNINLYLVPWLGMRRTTLHVPFKNSCFSQRHDFILLKMLNLSVV